MRKGAKGRNPSGWSVDSVRSFEARVYSLRAESKVSNCIGFSEGTEYRVEALCFDRTNELSCEVSAVHRCDSTIP